MQYIFVLYQCSCEFEQVEDCYSIVLVGLRTCIRFNLSTLWTLKLLVIIKIKRRKIHCIKKYNYIGRYNIILHPPLSSLTIFYFYQREWMTGWLRSQISYHKPNTNDMTLRRQYPHQVSKFSDNYTRPGNLLVKSL